MKAAGAGFFARQGYRSHLNGFRAESQASMRWNLVLPDFAFSALSDSLLLPVECR